jgi:RNA polymerase subunit RPABC4/transcription elongation factor Spt4
LRCGALVPFAALRCGSCGTPVAGAPESDERVRPCLGCGVILRFDQDPCPHCGAQAKVEDDRVKPCANCGELLPFEQLYCGACGELSIPIPSDQIPAAVNLEEPGRAADRWPSLLGGAAFTIGMVTLLVAIVEILR